MHCRGTRQSGFTIIELMLTLTIASIIFAVAIPNLRNFIWNGNLASASNDLVIAMTAARAEAIKARAQTIMCFSSAPNATTPSCNGTSSQGWIVFVDTDGDATVDSNEPVVVRHTGVPSSISLKIIPTTNGRYRAFAPTGFPRSVAALGNPMTGLVLCDSRGNSSEYGPANSTARGITISVTGRPRVTRVVSEIADTTNTDTTLRLGGCA